MAIKLNLIVAACENLGIGNKNTIPWKLKSEMNYFKKITSHTKDSNKRNVVIMGRKTWDSIPTKFKPLQNRINFVLSHSQQNFEKFVDVYGFSSFEDAISTLDNFEDVYENVWVIGGSSVYKEAMKSNSFYRLYMTDIKKKFECDTFFPAIEAHLKIVTDPNVPQGFQVENGIEFEYIVYESDNFAT